MSTILLTGATGFLGHHLVKKLLDDGKTVIAILGRPEDKANALPSHPHLSVYPCSSLRSTHFGHIDTLIHTAFSRGENLAGLSASLSFSREIIELVNNNNIESIINISSQGVYKKMRPGEMVDETGDVEPGTSYGLAKWAVENMLAIGCHKPYTNIRMASLSANARFLDFFVKSVATGASIQVTAPRQYASIMDVADAVNGILAVASIPPHQRSTIYNLGLGVQYSIAEYAQMCIARGQVFGFSPVALTMTDNDKDFAICMDCSRLKSKTGWEPTVTAEMMIDKMFNKRT
jgi:nucleoside-diphosphate-sugar epimerase